MKINLQVDPKSLVNPKFQAVLIQMCTELSKESVVKNLCLHEAGHLIYLESVRQKMSSDTPELEMIEPTILYNNISGEFEPTFAAVNTSFHKCGLQYTEEILSFLAQSCVAGGVFLHKLENEKDGGDSEDRKVFHMHFLLARGQGLTPPLREEKMWEKAQNEVQAHLENEVFKQMVRKRAAEIKRDYYSM